MSYLIRGEDYLEQFPDFELVDRKAELDELVSILSRKRASSVLLTGPGGVGASSICLGLQAMKAKPGASIDVVSKRLFWLDIDGLFSTGDSTKINSEFQRILKILERTPESIFIIDDMRDFIDACRNCGTMHFINALISSIKDGFTQAILEIGDSDLDVALKSHSDIVELFTMMDVREPVGEALERIVQSGVAKLEKHHHFRVSREAVETAIALTTKYRLAVARAQPERSLTMLDRAMSSYRAIIHEKVSPEHADELNKLAQNLRNGEGALLVMDEEIRVELEAEEARVSEAPVGKINAVARLAGSAGIETRAIADLRAKRDKMAGAVHDLISKFDILLEKVNAGVVMSAQDVVLEFSKITGIPAAKLNENEREKLLGLEAALNGLVFGQGDAVMRLTNAVKTARVGRRNLDAPLGSFMFIGPSGVGKTELAKALAQCLFDDKRALLRFDMSEYMEKHAVSKLIGAPPGYEGFEAGGVLTNSIRKNPNQIILFDEIEKAHPDVFNVFLQVLSDGRLTDNVGRTVNFGDTYILMTSNIGQQHFLDPKLTEEEARDRAMEELASTYRSEFLNRFAGRENIVCFRKLDLTSMHKIVQRELSGVAAAYPTVKMTWSTETVASFCADRYDPTIGARGLPGYISSSLEPKIVDLVLKEPDVDMSIELVYTNKSFDLKR